jgi:acetyl-CoA C-acetyltransferase
MTTTQDPIVIVGAARTPIAAFQGEFSSLSAPELGRVAIAAALARAGVAPDQVEELIFGCVLPAGLGQAPARQAALGAQLPLSTNCTTVNKMCGSGMKATMLANDLLAAGSASVIVAGGMESMTNAPYLIPKARGGYRIGHAMIYDHMMLDGLEDAYEKGRAVGTFGEDCADKYHFTRAAQDAFATESVRRAQAAGADGSFKWEIEPVNVTTKAGTSVIDSDEGPRRIKIDKIATLKPAFKKDGTVTAASSSSINDGAAALVLMRASEAQRRACQPIARIVGHASHAQAPGWFTTAPIGAIEKLYQRTGWSTPMVDLFEINEAFAVVPMAAMVEHKIAHERINIHGGACALGHPIGASGARILVTLLGALRKTGGKRGVASLCIGGGEATAMAVEML